MRTNSFSDFDSGYLDTPGPAGQLALIQPTDPLYPVFVAYSGSYNDQASLDADFPIGSYQFVLNNSATGATATVAAAKTGDYYPIVPRLQNFTALAEIDPAAPFTFRLASGLPPATPGGASVLSFYDVATGLGYTDQGVAFADQVSVPAGTFQRGHNYIYDILFVSEVARVEPETGIFTSENFYVFTRGAFFIASSVPEPQTWTMLLLGFAAVGIAQRRSRLSMA